MKQMIDKDSLLAVEFFLCIQKTSEKFLPIDHSFIPYQILLTVYLYECKNENLNIKTILHTGNYSDMGHRYHLKRLLENGWIKLEKSPEDARIKFVTGTEKLIKAFDAILFELSGKYLIS